MNSLALICSLLIILAVPFDVVSFILMVASFTSKKMKRFRKVFVTMLACGSAAFVLSVGGVAATELPDQETTVSQDVSVPEKVNADDTDFNEINTTIAQKEQSSTVKPDAKPGSPQTEGNKPLVAGNALPNSQNATDQPKATDDKTTDQPKAVDDKTTDQPKAVDDKTTDQPKDGDDKTTDQSKDADNKTTGQQKTTDIKENQPKPVPTAPIAAPTLDLSSVPAYTDSPYTVINKNVPYFLESEYITQSFELYSDLDSSGRCGVAYANVGQDIMPTGERGDIGSVRPSGWKTVKYDNVGGKYLYNRCHLIGYQLSGENANKKNLITGTRYLNVEGMLPFENMVADYIKETDYHVLYRITPIFEGDNLVASGVEMEAYSVEDEGAGISFHVYCYNVQPGISIDYSNGDSKQTSEANASGAKSETKQPVNTQQSESESKKDTKIIAAVVPIVIASNSEKTSSPKPVITTEPEQKPAPEPTPAPKPVTVAEPEPAPAPEPVTVAEPEPTPAPEPVTVAEPEPTPAPAGNQTPTYICNVNPSSLRFHYPTCSSVGRMKESNKLEFYGTRDEAIAAGYIPCGNCNP